MRPHESLGVAIALLAGLPSCQGRAADTAERVERLEAMLTEELGTEVKVRCPTMVDQSYEYCTAEVPSHEDLVFPVRVTSHGNELDYTTKSWVTGARMAKLGRHALEEKYDIAVDSIECPMISHLPTGAKARCESVAEGVSIPIEASMVIKVRKLKFEPVGGVVLGEHAARVAHETLHEQGVHAQVSCPRPVVVSVPGKRFECSATLPDQTTKTVHYLITGTDGTFELGTEPPKAGASADPPHAPEHHQEMPT